MAYIVLPHRWRRQPQVPVGIDWGDPLTNGLAVAVLPGPTKAIVNAVDGSLFSVTTDNVTTAPRTVGKAFIHGTESNYNLTLKKPIPSGTSARYTFGYFGAWNEGAQNIAFLDPSSTVSLVSDWPDVGRLTHFGGGGTTVNLSITNSDIGVAYAAGYDGTNAWVADRTSVATSAASGTDRETNTFKLALGWDTQGINAWTGLICLWTVSLNLAAVREFCRNPWQIFKPIKRRIYVDVGAAAGGGTAVPVFYRHLQEQGMA